MLSRYSFCHGDPSYGHYWERGSVWRGPFAHTNLARLCRWRDACSSPRQLCSCTFGCFGGNSPAYKLGNPYPPIPEERLDHLLTPQGSILVDARLEPALPVVIDEDFVVDHVHAF